MATTSSQDCDRTMSDLASPTAFTPSVPSLPEVYELIAADATLRDHDRVHPHVALDLLRRAGFGSLRLPKAQGGAGASLREVIGQLLLLAEADSNVAHIFRNHVTFVERVLVASDDPRRDGWREVVRNGGIVGVANTELDRPQTGGKIPLKTTLVRNGDGYRLNGTKFYSTGTTNFDNVHIGEDEVIVDAGNPAFLQPYISTLASHNPAVYKTQLVGEYELHGTRLPGLGFF